MCISANPACAYDWSNPAYYWSNPARVNNILSEIITENVIPGVKAIMSLKISNAFDYEIRNISIMAEAYLLLYPNNKSIWDDIIDPPQIINSSFNSSTITIDSLSNNEHKNLSWDIITTEKTSNGGAFAQSMYLIRFRISFQNSTNISEIHTYASRGFFSDEDWNYLTHDVDPSLGNFNITYLKQLGYDGIIPETSFIIAPQIPMLPLIIIISIAIIAGTIGFYNFFITNPSFSPRIALIMGKLELKATKFYLRVGELFRKLDFPRRKIKNDK